MSQRWKCSAPVAADPDPRRWARDIHVPIRTPRELSAQLAAREGSGAATCHADASAGANLPLEARPPTTFNAGDVSALCHSRARGDFCQDVLMTARYQGAQCSLWRRPRHARQSTMPVRHDSSATRYHNAYAVDPTVYAATYTASTGASPMGQLKIPLGQRVYKAMKRIRQEILHR